MSHRLSGLGSGGVDLFRKVFFLPLRAHACFQYFKATSSLIPLNRTILLRCRPIHKRIQPITARLIVELKTSSDAKYNTHQSPFRCPDTTAKAISTTQTNLSTTAPTHKQVFLPSTQKSIKSTNTTFNTEANSGHQHKTQLNRYTHKHSSILMPPPQPRHFDSRHKQPSQFRPLLENRIHFYFPN